MFARTLARLATSALALAATGGAIAQAPLTVHLSPSGDDARTGLTAEQSVRSLSRAHEIVRATLSNAPRDAVVLVAPGLYAGGQTVVWKFTLPAHAIVVRGARGASERPVFAGDGSGVWFTLAHARGEATNLSLEHLHVRDYSTAVNLVSDRNAPARSLRRNRIAGMVFERIGEGSTAAIRLVNADETTIVDNLFIDIVRTERCSLLHAIYVAHDSSHNRIEDNRFERNCGDPVRIRDGSNHNLVRGNVYLKAGKHAGFTEWYCDTEARTDCTKHTPECPSWGNEFRDNRLHSSWAGGDLGVYEYFQDDRHAACPSAPAGTARLRTSGND